jgi:hypothetical protein
MCRAYVHELYRAILRGISGSNEKFFRVFTTRSFHSLLSNLKRGVQFLIVDIGRDSLIKLFKDFKIASFSC